MTIEDRIFYRKHLVPGKAEAFGFVHKEGAWVLEKDFMDGDFHMRLLVHEDGTVEGTVIDSMDGEPYAPLRMESMQGSYVSSVRESYKALLEDIASACFEEYRFASPQARRIAAEINCRWQVRPDYPWKDGRYDPNAVFRHGDSRKWFALIMPISFRRLDKDAGDRPVDALNLKIDPVKGEDLRSIPGIYPAYHMNHKSWITVVLDGTVPDETVMGLVEESYVLTGQRLRRGDDRK